MKNFVPLLLVLLVVIAIVPQAEAGILGGLFGYGACQAACCTGWVACYAGLGLVAGTVTAGLGVPAAVLACNAAQGACMAACAGAAVVAAVATGPV
jgi:hypothetical protein